ncbi:ubiquitin-domain-containing protein [Acephala macrosclerotiorum]|nr:ubiquitin-domain-containing protein [Acephala macrosclerotiorum]
MSGRRQSQRSSTLKCEREEPEGTSIADTTPVPAKRRRQEPTSSKTALTMPAAATVINVPEAVLQVYQHMLPNNPEGIAFLFDSRFSEALSVPADRVAIQYRITKDDAIEELRRLLVIKAFAVDEKATKISPTHLMDELWHAAILDTQLYADLQDALGLVLHHRPSGASEQESGHREKRLAMMKAIYRASFSTNPLEYGRAAPQASRPQLAGHLRNPISIFVVSLSGMKISMTVDKQATIDTIKSVYENLEGVPADQQRLIFAGRQLEDEKTLEHYRIGNEATVHLVTRLIGC